MKELDLWSKVNLCIPAYSSETTFRSASKTTALNEARLAFVKRSLPLTSKATHTTQAATSKAALLDIVRQSYLRIIAEIWKHLHLQDRLWVPQTRNLRQNRRRPVFAQQNKSSQGRNQRPR